MIKLDDTIKGWHEVTDTEELQEGMVYFVEWRGCANFMLLIEHEECDLPFGTEILHFCSSIGEEAHHIRLCVDVDVFSVYAPDDTYNDDDKVSGEDASNLLLNFLSDKCLQIAKENWTENQCSMLDRLFESVRRNVPYKCVNCKYLDNLIDNHDSVIVIDNCTFIVTEDDSYRKPCEIEK